MLYSEIKLKIFSFCKAFKFFMGLGLKTLLFSFFFLSEVNIHALIFLEKETNKKQYKQ